MVPVSVPERTPVPVVNDRLTLVEVRTLDGALVESRACTVTGNRSLAEGELPPLTAETARCVGGAGPGGLGENARPLTVLPPVAVKSVATTLRLIDAL